MDNLFFELSFEKNKYTFGDRLIFHSPQKEGLKTPCIFIRDDNGRAVIMFAHAEWAARVNYRYLSKENGNMTEELEALKAAYSKLRREIDTVRLNAKKEAVKEARSMRASEIMEYFQNILYAPIDGYAYKNPKCGKCDEGRHIEIELPSGRKVLDTCACAADQKQIKMCCRMVRCAIGENAFGKITFSYAKPNSVIPSHYLYERVVNEDNMNIYTPGTPFRDFGDKIMFKTKEDCIAYCKWWNEKQGLKDYIYQDDGQPHPFYRE